MVLPHGRIEFARAKLDVDDTGFPCVTLLGHQSSGSNVGISRADALAWLPGKGGRLEVGETIRVLPLI
jgi:molybdopterin biosynthesis enzyme